MPLTKKRYIHEGWIHKWTNFIGSWRPRYFMLEPDCLSYSVEKDGVIKESFLLSHCKIRLCPDDPVRLDIEVVGSCLLCLRTDSALEKHKWYVSFKKAQKLAFQSHQKRLTLVNLVNSRHQDQDTDRIETEHEEISNRALDTTESNKNSETDSQSSSKDSKNISNIFVKTKSGREPKSSLEFILDNTETFEHISSKILTELETTTDSESLKHLNTFRLIVTDFCCSIKQLTEEEFRTDPLEQKYYTTTSLELDRTDNTSLEGKVVPNLFSDRSILSENQLYNDQYYECDEDTNKQIIQHEAELSEPFEDTDSSEDLIHDHEESESDEVEVHDIDNKESNMLDYHEFTIDTKGRDPDQISESEKSETRLDRFTLESRVFEPNENELSSQELADQQYEQFNKEERLLEKMREEKEREKKEDKDDKEKLDKQDKKHKEKVEYEDYGDYGDSDEYVEKSEEERSSSSEQYEVPEEKESKSEPMLKGEVQEKFPQPDLSHIKRRTKLPHARLEQKVSVWSILKDFIGKDLSRIRMPIVFNEPTSNLQRSAEDFAYYRYLNEATTMDDPIDRLSNVTIFSITPYSSAVGRSYKPFNPLLGETFEITHAGFNFFAEQVAHHPPILAFHCFNDKFESSGSLNMVINFTGKAIEANLMGPFIVDLKLPSGVEKYNIQRCNMVLHNLIFGKMWIEAVGYVVIRNVTGGDFSVMQYLKKGWFNKEIHKVRGLVFDKFGTQHYLISGIWSKHIFIEKVYSQTARSKAPLLNEDGSLKFNKYRYKNEADAWDSFVNDIDWENINVIPNTRREAWKPDDRPPHNEDYYGFGYLTMQLNELSEDYDKSKGAQMPKTDSRYRPDQRLYEEGKLEQATEEKKRLEDKQRAVAKQRADTHVTYKPHWFTKVIDPVTHQANWIYNGTYWEKKRDGTVDDGTPDIFG